MPDTEGKPDFMEKFVLSEIAGKKAAIHAYDGIVWKIRSGFLTLTFGGWAIMLQSLAGRDQAPHDYKPLVWGLYLFSLGFTLGAWFVDRSYIQRKFRVIIALDRLTEVLTARGGDCSGIPADLLIIAGDNAIKPYDCAGYRNALKAESVVYLAPLTVIFAVVFWLLLFSFVRRLPLPHADEGPTRACGQALDKARGRKPRNEARPFSRSVTLWAF